jgi:NADH:ubiquinone oxidoreductase subunit C
MVLLLFRKKFVEKNDTRNRKTDQLFAELPGALEGAILEKVRFGRSESTSYWVQGSRMRELCQHLKAHGQLTWLENLSCVQVDQNLLLTYFLRSSTSQDTAIIRVSLELSDDYQELVDMDSVSEVWESARTFENEIFMLFGVRFGGEKNHPQLDSSRWDGFPLRKEFIIGGTEGLR